MKTHPVAQAALNLKQCRDVEKHREKDLQAAVTAFCDAQRGAMRDMANEIGISFQYLSDIRHGRRKVSDAVVTKLGKLK